MADILNSERQAHWQRVYGSKSHKEVSWYQDEPVRSLEFIAAADIPKGAPIIDVGGGASTLVDHLLDRGHTDLTVLDLSEVALQQAQERLGARADRVDWRVANVVAFHADKRYALWHDRAVLHFLVDASDREHYVDVLKRSLQPEGKAVIATFGPEGPEKCSGLPVRRYGVEMLCELLGPEFELADHAIEDHVTPGGALQQFLYSRWNRRWRLETERLVLRRVTLDDADLMLAVWNDPAFVRNVGDRGIRSDEQAREALRTGALHLYAEHGYGPYVMVLKSDGSRIGICGLFKRDNLEHPDIGFAVLPDYCAQGYAGEAAFAVLDHARDDLDLRDVTAIVSPTNTPSIRLIEKLGLRFDRMITMPGDETAICLYRGTLGAK